MMINLDRYYIIGLPKYNRDFTDFSISEHGNLFGVHPVTHEKQQCDLYLNLIHFQIFGFLENVLNDEDFKSTVTANKEININYLKYIGSHKSPQPPTIRYLVFKKKDS